MTDELVDVLTATASIVKFCSIECELQMSGIESVSWMFDAWLFAMGVEGRWEEVDILLLGALVEPHRNINGYRKCGVRVGDSIKPKHEDVPRLMFELIALQDDLEPAEWFRQYEEVHPWEDGNGRSGVILFNAMSGSLLRPRWAPNFWNDYRRVPGHGKGSLT